MTEQKLTSVIKVVFVSGLLANSPKGTTVGEVAKAIAFMSKGQCQRVLDELVSEGYAYQEVKPHGRTGKKVYFMTEGYAMEIAHINRSYAEKYNGSY
jgi:DNA-binding IclR family transcriptional regulator